MTEEELKNYPACIPVKAGGTGEKMDLFSCLKNAVYNHCSWIEINGIELYLKGGQGAGTMWQKEQYAQDIANSLIKRILKDKMEKYGIK